MSQYEEGILRSLRRITRAIDLYSRQLASRYGLTGPQLVCLTAVERTGPITPSMLAREVDLSQATVTGILDRLAAQGYIDRERNADDRRRVTISLTADGRGLLERAPSPLHDRFVDLLTELPEQEQLEIHRTLAKVVNMMGAADLEAAPILSTGPLAAGAQQLRELLESDTASLPQTEPDQ